MIVFAALQKKQHLDRFGRFWPMKNHCAKISCFWAWNGNWSGVFFLKENRCQFLFFLLKYVAHLILVNQWGSDGAQRNFTTRGSKTTCNNSKQNVITPQHCGPNSIVHCYRVTQNLQILRSILFRIENKRNKEESERKILSSYWSGPSGFRTKMALEWR